MFRFADIGRQWVPVDLPQDGAVVRAHLLMDLIPREQLRERERELLRRTGAGLIERTRDVKSLADLEALFDETTAAEAGDLDKLVQGTHDWRGFGSADTEIGYAPERMRALLAYDFAFKLIRAALFHASREGVPKNSEPGPAGSQAAPQA